MPGQLRHYNGKQLGLIQPARRAFGRPWYVDTTNGNNGSDGQLPYSAVQTITKGISLASPGDAIVIARGSYDETVAANVAGLSFISAHGPGEAYIEPSAAGAEGMQVTADGVQLYGLGIDGDDTADYALNLNSVSRFKAYDCKFELGSGTGPAVLMNGTADDQTADVQLLNCEFAWCGTAVQFDDSAYGYVTQVRIKDSWFHNFTTAGLGVATDGLVKNLTLTGNTFDQLEDGTEPTDFILLSDNGNTGLIAGNHFALATNDTAKLTIGTGLMWGANSTEAGWSTARPA